MAVLLAGTPPEDQEEGTLQESAVPVKGPAQVTGAPCAFECRTVALSRDAELVSRAGGEQFGTFQLLHSMCSKPVPPVLSSGDSVQQTVFVEPRWAISPGPVDFAILLLARAIMQWSSRDSAIELVTVNVHPCKRLIIEKIVSREIDAACNAVLQVFRTHRLPVAGNEFWHDRLPESAQIQRIGSISDAMKDAPLSEYAALIGEAVSKLKWDGKDMIVYRAIIENPIPVANYTVIFERV